MVQILDDGNYLCKHFALKPYKLNDIKYYRIKLHDGLFLSIMEKKTGCITLPFWEKLIEPYIHIVTLISLLFCFNSIIPLIVLFLYFTFKYYFYCSILYTVLILPLLFLYPAILPLWITCMLYAEYVVKGCE